MERFDNQSLFENDITKGMNLFLGAGFSVNAKTSAGMKLPVGNDLVKELKTEFKLNLELPLPQFSTILEKTKREEFYNFLRKRYSVGDFDEKYLEIDKLNPKSIYTQI